MSPALQHGRTLRTLALSLCLLTAAPSLAQTPQTPLHQAVSAEVARAQQKAREVGVSIVQLDTGEAVFSYNPQEPRVIASNSKLFTTSTALEALGPGFQFETRFLMRGTVAEGVLRGDLGVVGSGDPQISGREYGGDPFAVFRPWAAALRDRGVRRISGDLYLAHGLFEALTIHPHWPRDQLAEWYEAPVSALSFSDNCILVRVSPGRTAGQPAVVETVPPLPIFRVDNSTSTRAKRRGTKLYVGRTDDLLTVRGTIDVNSGPFETWVTVPDPVIYFGAALRATLAEAGIAIDGGLRSVDQLPGPVWQRVAVHRSDLVTAVYTTNKRSQNFYAESLAKQVGARRCGQGSWRAGVRAIEELMTSIGIPPGELRMVDGSGMSRENQASPRAITTLLRHMFYDPAGPELVKSLPFSGEDNKSWKRRLAAPPYLGNVFAKTGTLAGVSALSGYARGVSGKSYAFSILLNGTRGDPHGDQDRILRALIDHG
ncbi:MAG: D-alanyl-D-alanine carboxypeptidase/D-alanyl-D-alanine-endopeptidase [Thermoanaerobaculia bacterium]